MRHQTNIAGIFIAAALICAVTGGNLCAAMIQFKPRAAVTDGVITLGDIADVLHADPEMADQLAKTVVGPAPAAGRELRLSFADIRSRLNATGVNLATMEFSGATVVVVSKSAGFDNKTISSEKLAPQRKRAEELIAEKIQKALVARNPAQEKLIVQVELADRDVTPVLQHIVYGDCEVVGGDPKNPHEQIVGIRFRDRKGLPAEIGARCRFSPQPMILAARYTIPPGHILREADLVWRQAEDAKGTVTRLEDALNRETKRSIRQDEPVRTTDIQEVPLVRSNDIVTVISRIGGVTIRAEMKSRDEGTLGETVTLTSLKGRDMVLARVTGLHEAEVISAGPSLSDTLQDATGRIEFRGEHR